MIIMIVVARVSNDDAYGIVYGINDRNIWYGIIIIMIVWLSDDIDNSYETMTISLFSVIQSYCNHNNHDNIMEEITIMMVMKIHLGNKHKVSTNRRGQHGRPPSFGYKNSFQGRRRYQATISQLRKESIHIVYETCFLYVILLQLHFIAGKSSNIPISNSGGKIGYTRKRHFCYNVANNWARNRF